MEPKIKELIVEAIRESEYQQRHNGEVSVSVTADFIASEVAEAVWSALEGLPKSVKDRIEERLAPVIGSDSA